MTDCILQEILQWLPDLPMCIDEQDAEAVVFQHIRWQRCDILQRDLWEASGSVSLDVLTHIDAYLQLTNRIGCSDLVYLHDIDALSLKLRADNTEALTPSLLIALVAHLRDDVLTLNIMIANGRYRPQLRQTTTQQPTTDTNNDVNGISFVENSRLRDEDIEPSSYMDRCNADAPPCVVCMDMPQGPRLPCRNKLMCKNCTAKVRRCPMCRHPFQQSAVWWFDMCTLEYYSPWS